MANKKPKVLDFDTEVIDGRSALEVYRTILSRELVEPIYRGDRVELRDILRYAGYPEWGFKRGVLPDHIKNISIDKERKEQVTLSYAGRLNHELEKNYWEGQGYSTRTVKKSMQVVDTDGKVVATYGLNRILIERDRLDQFIRDMR